MRYDRVITGTFVNRPNRFVAVCMLGSDEIAVHVKNTGRCRELLIPGARVVLSESDNPERKYRYDLVAVCKGDLLVNMDSQAPNTVFMEWLESEHPSVTERSSTRNTPMGTPDSISWWNPPTGRPSSR